MEKEQTRLFGYIFYSNYEVSFCAHTILFEFIWFLLR